MIESKVNRRRVLSNGKIHDREQPHPKQLKKKRKKAGGCAEQCLLKAKKPSQTFPGLANQKMHFVCAEPGKDF